MARSKYAVGSGENHCGAAFWTKESFRAGDDPEGGGGSFGDLAIVYLQAGEEDHSEAEEGDFEV